MQSALHSPTHYLLLVRWPSLRPVTTYAVVSSCRCMGPCRAQVQTICYSRLSLEITTRLLRLHRRAYITLSPSLVYLLCCNYTGGDWQGFRRPPSRDPLASAFAAVTSSSTRRCRIANPHRLSCSDSHDSPRVARFASAYHSRFALLVPPYWRGTLERCKGRHLPSAQTVLLPAARITFCCWWLRRR